MPLQIGSAALASLSRAAMFLVPGGVLSAAALYLVVVVLPDMGDLSGYIFAVVGGPPLTLLGFAWKHLKRAREERPSDLVFEPDAFRVAGGPLHGTRVAWAEVNGCVLDGPTRYEDDDDAPDFYRLKLWFKGRDKPLELAGTNDDVERASLSDVARTLSAKDVGEAKATAAPAEVLLCPSCRAPVAPDAQATVTCAFCSASVPMPVELREKVGAQRKVLQRDARAVQRLLRQPGAGFVGFVFGAAAAFMLLAWPVAGALLWRNIALDRFSVTSLLALVGFVLSCIAGFFTFARGRLVDRQALRLLTVHFCARPLKKGFACRSCDAPLPEGEARTLVGCAYCGAPNILAVDFRAQARAVDDEAASLTDALTRRSSERRRWRFATAAGLVLIALSGGALRAGFARDPAVDLNRPRCEKGDLPACVALGRALASRNRLDAELELKKACDSDFGEACFALVELWNDPLHDEWRDDRLPVPEMLDKGCELGFGPSCEALGELYKKGDLLRHVTIDLFRANAAYEKGCALGWAESCTDFGFSLAMGRGVEVDEPRAITLYTRACELGNGMGCNNLGAMYEYGKGGLGIDVHQAGALYSQACDAGVTLGCSNLKSLSP